MHDDDSKVYGRASNSLNKRDRDQFLNEDGSTQLTQAQMAITLEDEDIASSRIRSSEIKNLVSTINDLAVLFKELSILVVEQGTILDRIDYNIECAHQDVKQAVVHLENTVEIESSARSKSLLLCLITSILVCTLILVLKHT